MRKKRWLSSVYQVTHLRLELEDRQELLEENKSEFEKLVSDELGSDYEADAPNKPPDSNDSGLIPYQELPNQKDSQESSQNKPAEPEEENTETDIDEESESLKKLWKSIALATHPDRNPDNPHMLELYKTAHQAYKSKSFEILLEIAAELGIPLPDPDEFMAKAMELRKKKIEERLRGIETTVLWMWIGANPERKKELIKAAAMVYRKIKQDRSI